MVTIEDIAGKSLSFGHDGIDGTEQWTLGGYQLTEELLKQGLEFTAIVAFDDLTACAAIGALSKFGRQVAKHCSVLT
jgi:DNA-binding LacI/PurR family transcriptional regulator